MRKFHLLLLPLGVLAASAASAQSTNTGECIVAGRITAEHRWGPRLQGVTLLGDKGRVITKGDREWISDTRQVRIAKPAVLSKCNGDDALPLGDDLPAATKEALPALKPGTYEVRDVRFPKLRRGGELVELQVVVPQDKLTVVSK